MPFGADLNTINAQTTLHSDGDCSLATDLRQDPTDEVWIEHQTCSKISLLREEKERRKSEYSHFGTWAAAIEVDLVVSFLLCHDSGFTHEFGIASSQLAHDGMLTWIKPIVRVSYGLVSIRRREYWSRFRRPCSVW